MEERTQQSAPEPAPEWSTGQPAAQPTEQSPGHTLDGVFASLRGLGLRRNTDDRWLAGVCSGLGDRLGIDPLVVRGVLIVLLFLGGVGGVAYLVAWALLPDQHGRIVAEGAVHGDGWGIALLVLLGIVLVSNAFDRWWLWTVLLPVALIGWWALRSARRGKTPEQMSEEARQFAGRVAASLSAPRPDDPEAGQGSATAYAGPSISTPQAPHGMGPGRTGVVAAPARVVHRPRPRGGLLGLLLTAGLAVSAYGVGAMLATSRGWTGSPELIGTGFALGGAGLALVLVGLTGRRAGVTTLLVTVLAVGAVAGTSLPTLPRGGFGDRMWSASAQPDAGFSLTAGDAKLTLAGATPARPVRVTLGAGDLTVTVPKSVVADVRTTLNVGQVAIQRVGQPRQVQGGVDAARSSVFTVGTGSTRVNVDVSVGAGQITIVEEP